QNLYTLYILLASIFEGVEYQSPNWKKDWHNRTGFIGQSQARASRQAPSIRVHRAGHAAHYILHHIHVLRWLAAFFSRMPLDRRETRDWLRPGGPTCLRPNPTPHHTCTQLK
uniref:Retrotransposon protein, putative, unclassified n=1 Tax=Mesocestoides corti TaxID=53468 RepID=A0A5K3FQG3_MESCO